tara:strand:+ start:3241 stop:3573 length:333 start_codon:yes stop_codon:yes gene_type:complete
MKKHYIDYLNKDKNFTTDRKYFSNYTQAMKWGISNLDNFNTDMIKYNNLILSNVLPKLKLNKPMETEIKNLTKMIKDPIHSQDETNGHYLSDGEMLDIVVEQLERILKTK